MAEPLPERSNITLWRGDSRSWRDELVVEEVIDGVTVDAPLNLTGHTVIAQIRDGRSPSSALVAEMTVTIPEPASGTLIRTLSAEDSAAIPEPAEGVSYWWDLQVTRTADTFVRTYLYGKVKVDGDVSRT